MSDSPLQLYTFPNKYQYPEFAGSSGLEHLQDVLARIITFAQGQTVMRFVNSHANTEKCIVRASDIAANRFVTTRTIDMHLQNLREMGLVDTHSSIELIRGVGPRTVTIKDFSGLWSLAHQFSVWDNFGNCPLPCDKVCLPNIVTNETILQFVSQFQCYRSLLKRNPDVDLTNPYYSSSVYVESYVNVRDFSLNRIQNISRYSFDAASNQHVYREVWNG